MLILRPRLSPGTRASWKVNRKSTQSTTRPPIGSEAVRRPRAARVSRENMHVVIGAGLAGMTAALHLAERGLPVLLCEAHPEFLGGRTRARAPYRFSMRGEVHSQSFDHGQHCMWTQYWNMRALLERLGIWDEHVRPCATTRYLFDDGEEVRRLAPFNVDPRDPRRRSSTPFGPRDVRLDRAPRADGSGVQIHVQSQHVHSHAKISAARGLSMTESTMLAHPEDPKMWGFRGNLGTSLMAPLATALPRRCPRAAG